MPDTYKNFEELEKKEDKNNYQIKLEKRNSDFAIVAPHGGKIESFTTEIAEKLAADKYSFYSFIGKKSSNNKSLHITSSNFNEKNCLETIEDVQTVVAIHGCNSDEKFVYLGGLDIQLIEKFKNHLREINIHIKDSPHHLSGTSENNICNKGQSKLGVQIEISRGLREELKKQQQFFDDFTIAISKAIENEELS